MRAGRLKKRLILQSKAETRDSYGSTLITWTTEATVWGSLLPLRGQEMFAQQQIKPQTAVRAIIRYYSRVDSTWRISHGGKFYDIETVINENKRNRTLTLMCRQGVSETGAATSSYLLLEDGFQLLLESTGSLLLE